jgi:hypothetical protein
MWHKAESKTGNKKTLFSSMYLEFRTMDIVQKSSDSECYTASPEPFIFDLIFCPYQYIHAKNTAIKYATTDSYSIRNYPDHPVDQRCCHCTGGIERNTIHLRMTGSTSTDHKALERQQRMECTWAYTGWATSLGTSSVSQDSCGFPQSFQQNSGRCRHIRLRSSPSARFRRRLPLDAIRA